MKFRLNLYLIVLMVLVLLLGSCGQQASEGPEPKPPSESATSFNVPALRGAKNIALSMADSELFITDNFGYESTLYDNQLTLLASNKSESELRQALEDNLLEKGWRLYTDAPMESWKQGSQYLLIDISSNLSQTKIDNLRRSYAMDGLKLGDSLVVLYIMDESKALPNPTETAMAAARPRLPQLQRNSTRTLPLWPSSGKARQLPSRSIKRKQPLPRRLLRQLRQLLNRFRARRKLKRSSLNLPKGQLKPNKKSYLPELLPSRCSRF